MQQSSLLVQGYKFRFGLFAISDHDMRLIANAMGAPLQALYF